MSRSLGAVCARLCLAHIFSVAICVAPLAHAQSQPAVLPGVEITGYAKPRPKTDLADDPAANPASVTVIDLPEEKKRNTRDYTELLKPIMGVASNNFDQGGIGFGATMRGFSERSNGGGIAYMIDGVPVNLPSHALTNGYGDLTPLVPELLERIVVTRGPFDVRFGANALGGSMQFTTQDNPLAGAALSAGNHEYARGFADYPIAFGGARGYVSLLGSTAEGYRDNAELRVINTFNKLLFPMAGGTGSVRLQVFRDEFGAPGFIRRDFVENGTLNPRTAINSNDGGKTDLQILSFNYLEHGNQPLKTTVYVMHSDLDRYSNRASTVPINEGLPGQALQVDDRITYGATAEKYFRWGTAEGTGTDLLLGAGVRVDDAESQIFNTVRRVRGTQTEDTDFRIINPHAYAQVNYKPITWVKLTAGLRYDYLDFEIEDRTRGLNVSPSQGITQPKAGIVVSPFRGLDFFANYGRGFIQPSAIGGQLSREPNLEAPELSTRELGVQYTSNDGSWQALADVYRTTFSNEIQGRPPPLLPIPLGPSRRDGFDVEVKLRAYQQGSRALWLFANYSKIDGELVGRTTGTHIPDVAEYFFKYGFDLAWPLSAVHFITWSASQVWEGPKPINTTNTLSTQRFSRIDTKLTYTNRQWKGFSAFAGFIVYPDKRLEETAFTFGTPVTVGVSPKAPVTAQAGVFIPF